MDPIFDRPAVRAHRRRAFAMANHDPFLFHETAERLAERLEGVQRRFETSLFFGPAAAVFLEQTRVDPGRTLLADLTPQGLAGRPAGFVADEEFLPLAPASLDLIVSNLSLHWVNDLPGALLQMRQALKPDGLFLAALLGGETLEDLRQALLEGELAARGGASPRVSPFADLKAMAGLLQRAGFALPVADRDPIDVSYADPLALMRDLRALGESNALIQRRRGFTARGALLAGAARYAERFADADGRVPARFEVLFLTGWAPAASQPQPLRPGSARHRLADALTADTPVPQPPQALS